MQKRMIDALAAIPGVESVGLADEVPLGDGAGDSNVFTDATSDLRPANAAADALIFNTSPEYFRAAGTSLLSGRTFTWQMTRPSPESPWSIASSRASSLVLQPPPWATITRCATEPAYKS